MKRIITLMLAAGLVLGGAMSAAAIDFNAKGQWIMGFGGVDSTFVTKKDGKRTNGDDKFAAMQRLRLQMDAVASESLSGTVYFEIGDTTWGNGNSGGALGADGKIIELKRAYIDWVVPDTALSVRMGIQGVTLPNVAGGSSILDDDVAGITVSYKFNDNVSLTALWARPYNDNYAGTAHNEAGTAWHKYGAANFLDNVDLFSLMLPVQMDGWKITPWAMLGFGGKNYYKGGKNGGNLYDGTMPTFYTTNSDSKYTQYPNLGSNAYGTMVFAGLPFAITMFDPFNIEVDLNYGYSEGFGRYDILNRQNAYWWGDKAWRRGDTKREGWLAKALVEYKMDWGTPGIFGWYASGDDGNVKNGSERMPSIEPMGNFTSFMGDGNLGWILCDYNTSYAGTWGLGLQIRDVSFLEDLKHTFRVAYWGGTNSPSMVKYMSSAYAWESGAGGIDGPYLTTNDGLLEFNLVNTYQIYENLQLNLELGYVVNMIDRDTWRHTGYTAPYTNQYSKQDMWKAQLVFAYSF